MIMVIDGCDGGDDDGELQGDDGGCGDQVLAAFLQLIGTVGLYAKLVAESGATAAAAAATAAAVEEPLQLYAISSSQAALRVM